MSTPAAVANVVEQVIAGLAEATWDYLADIGWMEVILPGSSGRRVIAHLVGDDLYVRLDVENGDPLSVVIPAFESCLAGQATQPLMSTCVWPMRCSSQQLILNELDHLDATEQILADAAN